MLAVGPTRRWAINAVAANVIDATPEIVSARIQHIKRMICGYRNR